VIVIVDDATWSDDTVQDLDKVALVTACARGRHVLLNRPSVRSSLRSGVRQVVEPAGLAAWLSTLSPKLRKELEFVLEYGLDAAPGAHQSDVACLRVSPVKDRWRAATVTPATAAELLRRPLKLLLENRRNDLRFLLCMAEPANKRRLEEALCRGWVEPEMGGGLPELKRRLEALRSASRTAERIALARLWVMFDRDTSAEDRSRPSKLSEETRRLCCELTAPWPLAHHQLARRSIENYVPAETLRAWWPEQVDAEMTQKLRQREVQYRQQRVERLLHPAQDGGPSAQARCLFNFKKGLRGDLPSNTRRAIDKARRRLTDDDLDPVFRGLREHVRDALATGFPGLAEAFSVDGAVTEEAFRREVDPAERARLLASLFSRL
jgi:hypothetical protein